MRLALRSAEPGYSRSVMMSFKRFLSVFILVPLTGAGVAEAQEITAFTDVNVVPMDRERVLANQTVIVEGDRIVEIGEAGTVAVPALATIIDARGRYLVPGLWDAHMHLVFVGARPDFGDAPLYLAFGITSVANLGGDSTIIDLKRRIASGELLAPNLYTAGRQVSEPLIRSPAEAVAEVQRQREAGYDLMKFHEVFQPGEGYITTVGVDEATLAALNAEARRIGMPLLGHIQNDLGLSAALGARMSLAHSSQLLGGHFWPSETARFQRHTRVLAAGMALLALALMLFGTDRVVALIRKRAAHSSMLAALGAAAALLILLPTRRYVSTYHWLGALGPVWALTLAGAVLTAIAAALAWGAIASVRGKRPRLHHFQAGLGAVGAILIAFSAVVFWLPVFHRSTPSGLSALAREVKAADISVASSLMVEDTLVTRTIPELRYLSDRKVRGWGVWRFRWTRQRVELVRRGIPFFESVVGALDRENVPILLGTDALGFPLVVPGVSVHREMQLLRDAGLSPYRTLRTATVAPATFLGIDQQVGTVEVGKRADLLLVDGDPLENLETLRSPAGVMVRGRWIERDELLTRLEALADDEPQRLMRLELEMTLMTEGLEAALARYRELRTERPAEAFGEEMLAYLGLQLRAADRLEEAIAILELNADTYPESFELHDILGDTYATAGEIELAIESYTRAVELNPDYIEGLEKIDSLKN